MLKEHVVDKDLVVFVPVNLSNLSSPSYYYFGKRVHRKPQEGACDVAEADTDPFLADHLDRRRVHSKIPIPF